MDFGRKKLPKEAAHNLRICPMDTVESFALMPGPVYAFMKLNEKFISVKGPLDFFTPEELKRLRSFELFYLPSFVDSIEPFRHAARSVRSLLNWKDDLEASRSLATRPVLAPAQYELADAILRVVGPLWAPLGSIEPFFVAVFVEELCDSLPSALLLEARDRSVELFEDALMVSGWAVFVALHLGYCDQGFLNSLRRRVFEEVVKGKSPTSDYTLVGELLAFSLATVGNRRVRLIIGDSFLSCGGRIGLKMAGRFQRIQDEFLKEDTPVATIYGEGGFADE